MRRQFNSLFIRNEQDGYQVGDATAHRAAAALADRADAPTIQALADVLAMTELIGGQFHVTTVREKVDRYGNPVGDGDGEWATVGLFFHYETRDITVEPAKAPDEILGLPVTPSHAPATIIEVEEAEVPEAPEDDDVPPIAADEHEQDIEKAVALSE